MTVWIDDDATCEPPRCRGGLHHLYIDDFGRRWALRCPKSLSKQEQERVFFDNPPGSGRDPAKEYIAFAREQLKPRKHRREDFPEDSSTPF